MSTPEQTPALAVQEADAHALPTTIDGLVERFDGGHGLWLNGRSPTLDLPETSSSETILEATFQLISFDDGRVTEFEILEERVVRIDEDDYQALRLSTDQGPKLVLMRYHSDEWWVRTYEGE